MSSKPYYKHHIFFCSREREGGDCCQNSKSKKAMRHAADLIKDLDLKGKGKARVNETGCFSRCGEGPVMVIYPEGTWYRYKDKDDVEKIIRSHLLEGKILKKFTI